LGTQTGALIGAVFAGLALLSLGLVGWQWWVGLRFPLHWRRSGPLEGAGVTVLKPLKGSDETTEICLRSWFRQDYRGPVQLLLGVADRADPVCEIVRRLLVLHPEADAQLVFCEGASGANPKVGQLSCLEALARHEVLVVSDADVRVPRDFLANLAPLLRDPAVGLVSCFYRLANPATLAMHWEAMAVNADFWSQVLQARSLKPLDFALGAVMALRRGRLEEIGGFKALRDYLADDFQLGRRLARRGYRLELATVVAECWSRPQSWREVWKHQLRWARTIRVSRPLPYLFSILSNGTLWPLLWLAAQPSASVLIVAGCCLVWRIVTALHLQSLISPSEQTADPRAAGCRPGSRARLAPGLFLVPLKDLLAAAIWLMAFLGNRIEWGGQTLVIRRDGTIATTRQGSS
jgi:ceramide glucosyltransferase